MEESSLLVILGLISLVALTLKMLLSKMHYSPIPFFILYGVAIKVLFSSMGLHSDGLHELIDLFGNIGLALILFQVGLESDLEKLKEQISKALLISICEVTVSGLSIYFALLYLVGVSVETAMVVAIGFVATSIAISMHSWKEAKKLNTPLGDLLVDLSAMDDVAGITLMAVMFALVSTADAGAFSLIAWIIFKLLAMIGLAYLFSLYVERPLTTYLDKNASCPDLVITLLCMMLIFSGLVGYFDFSVALGAFLMGLAFSRNCRVVKIMTTYVSLESFFIPFFFISVGYAIAIDAQISWFLVLILVCGAFFGKVVGVGVPAFLSRIPLLSAFALGASMVPRAEVTLVILKHAQDIPHLGVTPELFTAGIIAVLITSLTPLFLGRVLSKV